MAKLGMKYIVAAIATDSGSAITYSDGFEVAKAIDGNIEVDVNDVKLPANDATSETDKSFSSGTVTLGVDDISDEARVSLLDYTEGAEVDAVTGAKELSTAAAEAPYVGIGFYSKGRKTNVNYWRAIWLIKVQFGEPTDEFKTKGETTEFQTSTIEGSILTASWDSTYWKQEARFSTEAGAIAWLNTKAGIPVSASGGLTGLALTAAGGTISPAFGAAVRYYTFGGVTATSFTVTPTAASHTIKLYVDGVYNQTVASGAASTAIAMASVGTKKVLIQAQEAGKSPQFTEIIVVKTA